MIKTTIEKAVNAYKALNRIWEIPFKLEDSRKMMLLKIELEKEAKFHDQEMQKLIGRYNPKPLENGGCQFETKEDKRDFEEAYDKIQNMEIEVDAEIVKISHECNVEISPSDLYAMMGFVEIE